jgi:hypothetical protein
MRLNDTLEAIGCNFKIKLSACIQSPRGSNFICPDGCPFRTPAIVTMTRLFLSNRKPAAKSLASAARETIHFRSPVRNSQSKSSKSSKMFSTDVSMCYGVQLKDTGPQAFFASCLPSFAARCNLFAMKTFADKVKKSRHIM